MNFEKLIAKLSNVGLTLMDRGEGMYSIGRSDIANPLLFFTTNNEYTGTVQVKSVNTRLYTPEQIHKTLCYVDTCFYCN